MQIWFSSPFPHLPFCMVTATIFFVFRFFCWRPNSLYTFLVLIFSPCNFLDISFSLSIIFLLDSVIWEFSAAYLRVLVSLLRQVITGNSNASVLPDERHELEQPLRAQVVPSPLYKASRFPFLLISSSSFKTLLHFFPSLAYFLIHRIVLLSWTYIKDLCIPFIPRSIINTVKNLPKNNAHGKCYYKKISCRDFIKRNLHKNKLTSWDQCCDCGL